MKKLLALVLTLLLCCSLFACTQTAAPTAEPSGEQPAADGGEPAEPGETGEAPSGEPSPDPNAVITFPYTLVDDEKFAVTIERYDPDDPNGPVLTLRYVNRTADQAFDFWIGSCLVNGFCVENVRDYRPAVEPGVEADYRLQFAAGALAECGINYIEQLAFDLRVESEMRISAPVLQADGSYEGTATLPEELLRADYSLRLAEPGAEPATSAPVYTHGFAEQVLADNTSYYVAALDYDPDAKPGPCFVLYFENRSERYLSFELTEFTVNDVVLPDDFSAGPLRYGSWMVQYDGTVGFNVGSGGRLGVPAGAKLYKTFYFQMGELAGYGVNEIKTLTFLLKLNIDYPPAQKVTIVF